MIGYLDSSVILRVVLGERRLVFATHDLALAQAARASGFEVLGGLAG